MRNIVCVLTLLAANALLAHSAAAQSSDFQWSGAIGADKTIEVRGVNGSMFAVASEDGLVHVEAARRGRRSDPQSVRIEVVEHEQGVTICAVYPDPPRSRPMNSCLPGGGGVNVENNDVRVDFAVRIPAGVKFIANTVNGEVHAEGLRSDVQAATVNGRVTIQTEGFVSEVATVNGDIDLELPAALNATFRVTLVNGRIESDFPMLVTGRISRKSLTGTIGNGGPDLRASTVNGNVRLSRR